MKQKTNQEVINAAFFALLTRNGVYIDYFYCWAEKRYIPYGESIAKVWENWAKTKAPEYYVISSFLFDKSHIPTRVWYSVHDQWKIWIADNLNN